MSSSQIDIVQNSGLTEESISEFIARRRILATGRLPSYSLSGRIKTIELNDFGSIFTLDEYKKLTFKTVQCVNYALGEYITFYAMEDAMPVMWVHRFEQVPKYHIDEDKFKKNIDHNEILNEKSKKDFKRKKSLLDFGQLTCLSISGKIDCVINSDYGTVFTLEKNGYVFKSLDRLSFDKGEDVKFSVIGENKQDLWAFNFPVPECVIL
jgi:hypothetical protein